MAIFLYLLREVYFRFQIGPSMVPLTAAMQVHLEKFIRPQDVTMLEPP